MVRKEKENRDGLEDKEPPDEKEEEGEKKNQGKLILDAVRQQILSIPGI
jgi:hypothetical protein